MSVLSFIITFLQNVCCCLELDAAMYSNYSASNMKLDKGMKLSGTHSSSTRVRIQGCNSSGMHCNRTWFLSTYIMLR